MTYYVNIVTFIPINDILTHNTGGQIALGIIHMIIDKGQWEQTELVEDGLDWNFEMEKMEYNPKSMFVV